MFFLPLTGRMIKACADVITCKEEYDTLLREMRDPEVRAFFGAEEVLAAKELAKQDWMAAERLEKH